MHITIHYVAQIAGATGLHDESLELPPGATAADALATVHAAHQESLQRLVFAADGAVLPAVIVCLNNRQVQSLHDATLADGDELLLFSAISGG
jgi:molybdopterin converting factor small subunit